MEVVRQTRLLRLGDKGLTVGIKKVNNGLMQPWNPARAKKLIELRGRTRRWVARQCGVEPKTFNHYLAGKRNPSMPVLMLMAQVLETTVQDLWPDMDEAGEEIPKAAG